MVSLGQVVVGLVGALEAYSRFRGLNSPLVQSITERLGFDSEPAALRELVETRHLYAHRQGVVDRQYVGRVTDTPLHIGEVRPLSFESVLGYATLTFGMAALLRERA